MTTGEPATRATTEATRESAAYAERIRRTNERLALAVCAIFAITGLLPITQRENRTGVLLTALVFFVLILAWFRLVPPTALGDRRVVVFGILVQPVVVLLLSLTGGNESPYFPYLLLSLLITVYSPRTPHTFIVGAVSAAGLLVVAIVDRGSTDPALVVGRLVTELLQLLAFVLFTAFAGRALREARQAITARAEELASERTDAIQLAFTDTLTGLYNRRYADDLLKRLVFEAARGRPFSVLALDLDRLKQLNDTLGHATGDRVITRIGELLRLQLRGADVPIRVGGDEFLALLPGTREDQARAVGERLRAAVRDDDWSAIGMPVSISVGAAEWRSGQTGDNVVKAADTRLYEAKRARVSAT
ncbi:MAG TPA: GGDEF domain-containing protein [Candidatus Limnocylindria bacterium]|jgi:diguanylate cyclase (GGDEF)-like protein|nr:GGDEF domain-containing protein [Candidatus Limnocylindria bacterium]